MSSGAHTLEDSFLLTCTAEPCLLSSSSSASFLSSHYPSSGQLPLGNMMSTPSCPRGRISPTENGKDDKSGQLSVPQETSAFAGMSTIKASFTRLRKELDVQQLSSGSVAFRETSSNGSSQTKTDSLSASKRARDKISAHRVTTITTATESLDDGPTTLKRSRRTSPAPTLAHLAHPPYSSTNTQDSNKNMKTTVPQPFTFTTSSSSSTDTASMIPDRQRHCSNPVPLLTDSIYSKRGSKSGSSKPSSREEGVPRKRKQRSEELCVGPQVGYVPPFREIHLQDEAWQARRIKRIRSERTGDKEREQRRLGKRVEQRGRERARWEQERRERERERERGREEEQKREQKQEELQIQQERKATVFKANPVPKMYSSTLPHTASARPRTRAQTRAQTHTRTPLN